MGFQFDVSTRAYMAVQLEGDLSVDVCEALEKELPERIARTGMRNLLFDFRDVTDCGIFSRSVFVRVQSILKAADFRTAYLADRSRYRGLALWIVHLADDEKAKPVMSLELANDWFEGKGQRKFGVRTRLKEVLS